MSLNEEQKVGDFFRDLAANAPAIADKPAVFENITAEAAKRSAEDISLVKPSIFLFVSVICAVISAVAGGGIIAATNFGTMDALNFTLVSVAGKTAEYMFPDEFVIAAAISISSLSIVIVISFMFLIAIIQKALETLTSRTESVR
ncbi:MAG TPA: hypothetical protein PKK26_06475 [Candidatus Wallbacteria bacterium]|nr:hypothetical protein [Candidatus Wallbacteria bacterium]